MSRFINIGFGNVVSTDKVIAVVSPDAAPVKRMIQTSKEQHQCIDATQGRKTRTVLVMDSGHIVLSALVQDTILKRLNGSSVDRSEIHGDSEELL